MGVPGEGDGHVHEATPAGFREPASSASEPSLAAAPVIGSDVSYEEKDVDLDIQLSTGLKHVIKVAPFAHTTAEPNVEIISSMTTVRVDKKQIVQKTWVLLKLEPHEDSRKSLDEVADSFIAADLIGCVGDMVCGNRYLLLRKAKTT
jgi:hypothetical protein